MSVILLIYIFFIGRRILKAVIDDINKNPTVINLLFWFIMKTLILFMFIYYFDIIFYTLKEDIEIFINSLNIFNENESKNLYIEIKKNDIILQEVERLDIEISKYEKSELYNKRPIHNTILILNLLIRDFKYYKNKEEND